jgi:hypothetical protein
MTLKLMYSYKKLIQAQPQFDVLTCDGDLNCLNKDQ